MRERANEQISAAESEQSGVTSKQMSERCYQTSERGSEWPKTLQLDFLVILPSVHRIVIDTGGDDGDVEVEEEDEKNGGAEGEAAPTPVEFVALDPVVEKRGRGHIRGNFRILRIHRIVRLSYHHHRLRGVSVIHR